MFNLGIMIFLFGCSFMLDNIKKRISELTIRAYEMEKEHEKRGEFIEMLVKRVNKLEEEMGEGYYGIDSVGLASYTRQPESDAHN